MSVPKFTKKFILRHILYILILNITNEFTIIVITKQGPCIHARYVSKLYCSICGIPKIRVVRLCYTLDEEATSWKQRKTMTIPKKEIIYTVNTTPYYLSATKLRGARFC